MSHTPGDLSRRSLEIQERDKQLAAQSSLAPESGSENRPLTLTVEEIRHLAQFAGVVIPEPTGMEKDDERETEITIAGWPAKGVKGDDGMLPAHKHIAYFSEYPEEGCVPLGSPNTPG